MGRFLPLYCWPTNLLHHTNIVTFPLGLQFIGVGVVTLSHVLWSVVIPNCSDLQSDTDSLMLLADVMFPIVALVSKHVCACAPAGPRQITCSEQTRRGTRAVLGYLILLALFALVNACRVGSIRCVSWLAQHYSISKDALLFSCAFAESCSHGQLSTVNWLSERFTLNKDDICDSCDSLPLRLACQHGQLHVAQWLSTKYSLTAEDARALDNQGLNSSCENGHLSVASWLTDHFMLNQTDARSNDNYCLRLAAANGHLETVKWLSEHFSLTLDDVSADNFGAFRLSCANGHEEVAKYLAEHYSLKTEHARCMRNYALRRSCEQRHLSVCKWLVRHFTLSPHDVASAVVNIHDNDVTKWVNEQFPSVAMQTYSMPMDKGLASNTRVINKTAVYV